MSGDERRTQILEVAIKLFSQRGFSGTTTKEIARSAGVSEAMVFKHFANKEELYSAILDLKACDREIHNRFEDLIKKTAAKDDFGVFYTMALNALDYHSSDSGFMRLMLHSALEEHDLARMFFESFVTEKYKFLGDYIEKRQADGAFREIEPRVVVRAFMGMFVQHSLYSILWDRDQKILQISNEEAAQHFTEILLNGIKN
ncbi:MAG: TetR/AcrR family transcriptional regulator [Acidobacteriota bacterium]|nr:TetR/AcrR family transcriptional regulator [Acidobacteriota bacterium]